MGFGFSIKCKNCDYSKEFMLGIGMAYNPDRIMDFDSIYAFLPGLINSEDTIAEIRYLVKDKNAKLSGNYGNRIYHCPKCNILIGKFYFQLEHDDGSFEIEYKCSSCKTVLKQVGNRSGRYSENNLNIKKYPCPRCGKHSLYEDTSCGINWD